MTSKAPTPMPDGMVRPTAPPPPPTDKRDNFLCPVCGVGRLTHHASYEKLEYKGKGIHVKSFYSICDTCEVEQSDHHELKLNKHEVINGNR
jgi:rubredoxin